MSRTLILLVLVVLVPLLLVQAAVDWSWYRSRWHEEEESSLEEAAALATTFGAYARDVRRQQLAVGTALTKLRSFTAERANGLLDATAREYPLVRSWHWAGPDGTVLASSDREAIGRGLAGQPYFAAALSGQKWAISDCAVYESTAAAAVFIARGIMDDKGAVKGVMVAAMDADKLHALAIPLRRGKSGVLTLFDRKGVLVFCTPGDQQAHRDRPEDDPLLQAALEEGGEKTGVILSPFDGAKHIAARVPDPDTGWVAGASRPVHAAMSGVYTRLWIAAGLNALVLAFSILGAAAISRQVVGQLRRLQEHARCVGRREVPHQTESGGIRELAELAAAFNRMGDDVNRARGEQEEANLSLEKRVQERTAELATTVRRLSDEAEERGRAERLLQEQSRVLDAFFRHTMTCLAFLDHDFNFIRVNEAYARACRREASDFPGRNHFELYPHEENEAIFRGVVGSKVPYQALAKPFTFPDHLEWGTTYWDWTLVPILGSTGETEFLVFSLQDVTERKRIERQESFVTAVLELFVRKSSRKGYLDSVVEAIAAWSACRCVGIRVLDDRGNIPYESFVGFSREFWESENRLYLDKDVCVCTRVIRQQPDPQEAAAITAGGSFRCDNAVELLGQLPPEMHARYRGVCMRTGFTSLAVIPIRYREQILGAIHLADERECLVPLDRVAFLESIAPLIGEAVHRFNVEDELRSASRYTRGLLEASLDPLVTISPEGRITDVNRATEEVAGIPRERLIGSDFSEYFTEPERASAGYRRVLAEGLVTDYPLTVRHAAGNTTDVLYNAVVYRNEAGQVQGVFAAARDITERKRAEKELAEYREHLEDLVEQRTDELARSNQELEQFAYIASHDLQEPLRVIIGYLQLIDRRYREKLDADADQFIQYAVEGANRMQQLIADLLEYSRVGTRGQTLRPTDAEAALGRTLTGLRKMIEDSHAVVTHDPLPSVMADEPQLIRLLQNLIANGIKFSSERRPEIHVSARREGDGWLFSVRDNGIGIERQYWDQIFVIFQRLHTRKKYSGTGIGLSICKKIVERHGGRIWLDSTPGQGTTFYFTM
jgi:PAS domain S-box-containing protein